MNLPIEIEEKIYKMAHQEMMRDTFVCLQGLRFAWCCQCNVPPANRLFQGLSGGCRLCRAICRWWLVTSRLNSFWTMEWGNPLQGFTYYNYIQNWVLLPVVEYREEVFREACRQNGLYWRTYQGALNIRFEEMAEFVENQQWERDMLE